MGKPFSDDLDDGLADLFASTPLESVARDVESAVDSATSEALRRIRETTASVAAPLHREKCKGKSCRNGRFITWSGRDGGPCVYCKGLGYKEFKTSTESRVKAKMQRVARAERSAAESWESFVAEHSDLAEWIVANAASNTYAAAMRAAVEKYGALTERQEIGIRKWLAAAERRKLAAVARESSAPTCDTSKLESAMATARSTLGKPKLRAAGFTFSFASDTSANAGALYVKAGGQYLGKIKNGKFFKVRECTPEQESEVLRIANDPKGAAIAYGKETGVCACCGITLTNPESIERGIGPICASKFGW